MTILQSVSGEVDELVLLDVWVVIHLEYIKEGSITVLFLPSTG